MDFFTEAKHFGLHVEKLLEIEMEKLLFDSDPGVSYYATKKLTTYPYRMRSFGAQYMAISSHGQMTRAALTLPSRFIS